MKARTRKMVASVVAISIVLALLFSLLTVFTDGAAGHAEMQRSAPRPTQAVGGLVDRVEMAFREPIRPFEGNQVVLEFPDGNRIQTQVELNSHLVRGRFAAISEPGIYKVIWGLVDDNDGDWTTEEFPFTYAPNAAAPEWLPATAAGGPTNGGSSTQTILLIGAVVVAVVLAAWLFWPRRSHN